MSKIWEAIKWLWYGLINALSYVTLSTSVDQQMPIYQMLAGLAVFL